MKIVIADDHDLVRDALSLLVIRDEPSAQVLGAKDYQEACELTKQNQDLDLVMLDMIMPGMNSMTSVEEFIQQYPSIPLVLMSGYVTQSDVEKAFALGVKGFIPKTLNGKALMSALRLIISGARYVPDIMLTPVKNDSVSSPHNLSQRETQVLQQLALGLSNKVIARNLTIEETTVKLHLRSLFKKLEANNRTEVVILAMEQGLIKKN